jgi:endonuclease-3
MKSKGIHGLSHILLDKHDGKVPEFWVSRGASAVGHKTASVVMSQAFGVPAFPWIRIYILMYRWNLTNGKNVVQTEKDAKRLFPRKYGTIYTYKLYGMGVSTPARGWI